MKRLYVKSGMINTQDLEHGKEEKFRLWAREFWKCALRLDNEQWPSRGGKGEKSNQQEECGWVRRVKVRAGYEDCQKV